MPNKSDLVVFKQNWLSGERGLNITPKHEGPILPIPGEKNILITSALPYVNNVPHLGNLVGSVLSADVFARFCRARNYNVLYICGTDEYGTATETKALEEKTTPRKICDEYHSIHREVYDWFNISFDYFGRTSTWEQVQICQGVFLKIMKNGYTFTDFIEQWLCGTCDRYLADRFVLGTCPLCGYLEARGDQCDKCGHLINAIELVAPRCKICGATPEKRSSLHYFLDLPKIEPELKVYLSTVTEGWSSNARAIAETWVKEGLKPRCITRDLKWGVPVPLPGYENKVFYVWFDAPLGYVSITQQYSGEWGKWWLANETDVELVQFMAKDNVPFHSVMFPSCLLATQQPYNKPTRIYATEYLNFEGEKFSKSRGVGVFGKDAAESGIPSDVWRFYLLYIRPEAQDSNFSWRDFAAKTNTELLNNIGNFIYRTLKFIDINFFSTVPKIDLSDSDVDTIEAVDSELQNYLGNLNNGKLREGVRNILAISRIGNQYMQTEQPWVSIKLKEKDRVRAGSVLALSANIVSLMTVLLAPYMPDTCQRLLTQLSLSPTLGIPGHFKILLRPGSKLATPLPLFKKIEDSDLDKLTKRFSGVKK